MTDSALALDATPYAGYSYAYPHKTAYRALARPVPLAEAWAEEPKDALFLYVHVPFCEMRCGFCNLFTSALPPDELVPRYLAALRRQAAVARDAIGPATFARVAVGGGTPTFLDAGQLAELFDVAEGVLGADMGAVPVSVEVSPATVDAEKLRLLAERGVTRASLGVQTFLEDEAKAVGRPQSLADVDRALGLLRDADFDTLNVDLIYGIRGQTPERLAHSIRRALEYRPEEVYLYPLYVRPLTGLGRTGAAWEDARLALYRAGRDLLLGAGYEQRSMRMFRLASAAPEGGPVYCCQNDGMIGIGCGARSYTRGLHYSDEYAVGREGVRDLIGRYVARDDRGFGQVAYGFALDGTERRRRFAIQSLLTAEGVDVTAYAERFGTPIFEDIPELVELERLGLATSGTRDLRLTPAGVERSDAIGPWLYSPEVRRRMREYDAR